MSAFLLYYSRSVSVDILEKDIMDSGGSIKSPTKAAQVRDLDWQFCQVFGEPHFDEVTEVDIVSAVEFEQSGEYLAAGDKGGRVVVFQRVQVRLSNFLSRRSR